ncbi:MAG: gluconate 2-dehydrogenase subunit 3 family protein [Deltaproteobacteria bacterium]|nr:gluconate 2-dehydrogenase subunit 3 family protein [Deltaproteobacteria bacterium]
MTISRRDFLLRSALYGGAVWAAVNVPRPRALAAAAASATPAVLTPGQWRLVEAITGRIIPSDDEPGAVEAGVVNFIDKALAHEDAALAPVYAAGLAGIDAVAAKRFRKPFVALGAGEQDEILAVLESGKAAGWPEGPVGAGDFFAAVRAHTVFGFLADPSYGGNRGWVGWKVVGYPGRQHHRGGYTAPQMLGTEPIVPVWKS